MRANRSPGPRERLSAYRVRLEKGVQCQACSVRSFSGRLGPSTSPPSWYHPEKLLDILHRASADEAYRRELESGRFRFDFDEKAINTTAGRIYTGDRFVADLLEVEATLGVELQFPDPVSGEPRPSFPDGRRPVGTPQTSVEKKHARGKAATVGNERGRRTQRRVS